MFDGKPTKLKEGELAKRHERRELAEENLEDAKETGRLLFLLIYNTIASLVIERREMKFILFYFNRR